MASLLFRISSSSPYAGLLAALILAAPAAFALTTEQHRRAPESTTMAFSPLAITGYALLAIVASYILLRLYQYLKPRLSSTARELLPQPVSAGRTSSLSLFSPFSLLRTRPKLAKTASAWSRWSPLPALIRRFTRPSSPLHLSGMELLPTTMPHSPTDGTHSLIDLPLMTGSFPVPNGQTFRHNRVLSKSSSMDALPSYRPLTPVPVLVPVPVRTAPLAPSTPPPPSPTPIPRANGLDIPLAPVPPPKPQFTPVTMMSTSGLLSPPLTGTFPAIALSPSKPNGTVTSTTTVVGSRPGSPSPSLFLSSHTISSLSLSPRSLSQQQHRRSKSLGGVTVKRISPPRFDWDEACTQDVVDSEEDFEDNSRAHTLVVPALEKKKEKDQKTQNRTSPIPSSNPSKFLLNFSSSSSSSASGLSMGSPSPLTSNSGSAPDSAPLLTPRTPSSSSHSSDIAKFSEKVPPFPKPIPLVDVDTNVNTDMAQGFTSTSEKATGWSFDVDEPMEVGMTVEQVLLDLDMSTPAPPPVYMKTPLECLGFNAKGREDQKLIETEDGDAKVGLEQPEGEKWEWDNDLEGQDGCWGIETQTEPLPALQTGIWNSNGPVPEDGCAPSSPLAARADTETSAPEAEGRFQYPDPDLLPLPDVLDALPSATLARVASLPTITISTHEAVLCKKDSDPELDVVNTPSKGASTPVAQAQTPTPPASPPREARMSPLPSADGGRGWRHGGLSPGGSTVSSPAMGESLLIVDMEAQQDVPAVFVVPAVGEEDLVSSEGDQAGGEETAELDEVDAEELIVTVLDKGLVCSPASIPGSLSDSDTLSDVGSIAGSTLDVELAVDRDEDGVPGVRCEVVPASPSAEVPGWDYGYDEEEEEGQGQEVATSEGATDVKDSEVIEVTPELEPPPEALPQPAEPAPALERELPPCSISTTPVSGPAPEPSTSLPEIPLVSTPTIKAQTQAPSPPQEIRQRKRTALEEAVERTRSPLEVALAMQLRPGLGVGADPAWMVRFLMVMWGWVFGIVLVPSA